MDKFNEMTYNEIKNVICNNNICSLAVSEENFPYVIPMYYKTYYDDGQLHLEMFSKSYGKKMRCIKNNENISLLIIQRGFGTYKSVIVYGIAKIKEYHHYDDKSIIDICIKDATGRTYC